MATPSFSVVAQGDLSCPVCFELFTDPHTPKELDCSHVCCALCIQKILEGERSTAECPECRHVTQIPKEGVIAMRTIFRLRSLAEKHREHLNKKEAASLTRTRDESTDTKQKIKDETAFCLEHNIVIDFFCKKCNFAGCSTCMMRRHQGKEHDAVDVASVHEQQKEHLNIIFHQIDTEIQQCVDSFQELTNLQESMEQILPEQHRNIDKQLEIAVRNARENAQQLKQQINALEKPKIEKVKTEICRVQRQMHQIKTIKKSVQTTVDTFPMDEYVEQHAAIVESVTCELGKDFRLKEDLNSVVGRSRFLVDTDVKLGNVSQVKTCKLVQTQELGVIWCRGNRSVAITSNGLLAVCVDRCVMCIYRRQLNGKYQKETSIILSLTMTRRGPNCVAVSIDGKFLVAREGSGYLEVYSQSGEFEGTFNRKPGLDDVISPSWVLVENDIGVLVVNCRINSNILRFTHDGVKIDTIPVPFPPGCAALLPNELVAVSNWNRNKLCFIDMNSKQTVRTLKIDNARAICYHKQSDTLLVGRCLGRNKNGALDGNGVIEQYCPTSGRLVARIFERRDGLSSPKDMVLTSDNKLIVSDYYYVRVYDITC